MTDFFDTRGYELIKEITERAKQNYLDATAENCDELRIRYQTLQDLKEELNYELLKEDLKED